MLNSNHLESIFGMLERLGERGEVVAPIEGTAVAQLVNACWVNMPGGVQQTSDGGEWLFMKNSRNLVQGVCEHDCVMDELSTTIAETVARNIDWARTVVNPAVKKLYDYILAYSQERADAGPKAIEIVPQFYTSLWDNPTLAEMVRPYSELPVENVPEDLPVFAPVATDEEAIAAARTGIGHIDAQAAEMFSAMSEGMPKYLFNAYFANGQGDRSLPTNGIGNATNALAVFLWARALMDEVPESMDVDSTFYREVMVRMMSRVATRIAVAMRQRELLRSSKAMNLSYAGDKIYVDGDVYNNQFLSAGGTPELLMGASMMDQPVGFNELINGKERYEREWTTRRRLHAAAIEANKLDVIRNGVVRGLRDLAKEIPEDLCVVEYSTLAPMIEAIGGTITERQASDLYRTCRDVVCRVLYPHIDALKILTLFDEVMMNDEGMDERSAALLVSVDLLCCWVANQLTRDKA